MSLSAVSMIDDLTFERLDTLLASRPGPVPLLVRAGAYLDRGDVKMAAALATQAWQTDNKLRHVKLLFQRTNGPADFTYVMSRMQSLVSAGFAPSPLIAYTIQIAARSGATEVVRRWMDYDRLLWVGALNPPDSSLNARLAAALSDDIVYYIQSEEYPAIRTGWRRNGLKPDTGEFVLDDMFSRLKSIVADWIAALPDDPTHPFLAAKPRKFRLNGWSVVSAAQTHHVCHIHPQSWANLVVYAEVPPIVHTSESRQGWLRIGPNPAWDFDESHGFADTWIEPTPGMVVLMPSYFPHESIPTGCETRRVCAAIQVYPADGRDNS